MLAFHITQAQALCHHEGNLTHARFPFIMKESTRKSELPTIANNTMKKK
jgi:hypothetical protein